MTINNMAFTPTDGLKNATSFPTNPVNEAAARKQIQDVLDQIQTYLNGTLTAGVNAHLAETATDDVHGLLSGGKIIEESGSNANGDYVRFADGTQICYRKYILPVGSAATHFSVTSIAYPASFVDVISGSLNVDQGIYSPTDERSTARILLRVLNLSAWQNVAATFNGSITSGNVTFYLSAFGRWK